MTHKERGERRKQIAAAVRSGLAVPDVARDFGVGIGTVYEALRRHGVATAAVDAAQRSSFHILAALIDSSKPLSRIARERGVSPQRVHQVLKAAHACGIRTGRIIRER